MGVRGGGEGEWGSKLPISLHYLAQGEGQGWGLRSLPLYYTERRKTKREGWGVAIAVVLDDLVGEVGASFKEGYTSL